MGAGLIAVGLAMIVWAVLQVANASQGGRTRRTFAERIGYDEAKQNVHRSFPGGLVRGLAGLAVAMLGARLRRGAPARGVLPASSPNKVGGADAGGADAGSGGGQDRRGSTLPASTEKNS